MPEGQKEKVGRNLLKTTYKIIRYFDKKIKEKANLNVEKFDKALAYTNIFGKMIHREKAHWDQEQRTSHNYEARPRESFNKDKKNTGCKRTELEIV